MKQIFCTACGAKIREGNTLCANCGRAIGKTELPTKKEPPMNQRVVSGRASLSGIEGWLALLCLGFVIDPFIVIYDLTISGGNVIVVLIDLILLGLLVFIWYLIYKKDHRFSKFVVIFLCIGALIGILNVIGTSGQDSSGFRSIVVAAIWIPYVLTSKRVKSTFIN
jgi:peptidoglycan/LPS O-acetylase OafA/YrhL